MSNYSQKASYRFFFFNDTATTEIYTLSLHDALPIPRVSRLSQRLLILRFPSEVRARPVQPFAAKRSASQEVCPLLVPDFSHHHRRRGSPAQCAGGGGPAWRQHCDSLR